MTIAGVSFWEKKGFFKGGGSEFSHRVGVKKIQMGAPQFGGQMGSDPP